MHPSKRQPRSKEYMSWVWRKMRKKKTTNKPRPFPDLSPHSLPHGFFSLALPPPPKSDKGFSGSEDPNSLKEDIARSLGCRSNLN